MKVAVIGNGLGAYLTAIWFHQLETNVTLFCNQNLGDSKLETLSKHFGNYSAKPLLSRYQKATAIIAAPEVKTVEELFHKYLPLAQSYLREHIKLNSSNLKRVHKRFIDQTEVVGPDRMKDFFRVVYKIDPSSVDEKLLEELPKEIIQSVESESEGFEDFDIVVEDQTSCFDFKLAGPSGAAAINEQLVQSKANLMYGLQPFSYTPKKKEHILLIGSGEMAALNLIYLKKNFEELDLDISIVTTEAEAFAKFTETSGSMELVAEVSKLLENNEKDFQERASRYEQETRAYRDLPDHERVKAVAPVEPSYPISIYANTNVVSIDKLIDREDLFVTIELSKVRSGGDFEAMKTLKASSLFIQTGKSQKLDMVSSMLLNFRKRALIDEEPGYFTLIDEQECLNGQLEQILKNLELYFTKK